MTGLICCSYRVLCAYRAEMQPNPKQQKDVTDEVGDRYLAKQDSAFGRLWKVFKHYGLIL